MGVDDVVRREEDIGPLETSKYPGNGDHGKCTAGWVVLFLKSRFTRNELPVKCFRLLLLLLRCKVSCGYQQGD